MAESYVLQVHDETGAVHEVPLLDFDDGYTGLGVYDELYGQAETLPNEIDSVPEESPPSGELPVLDESGTQHLIAFSLAGVTGIYELAANALYGFVEDACAGTLGVACSFENAPSAAPDIGTLSGWAETRIDWGAHEQIGFGSQSNRYRLRGDLFLTVSVPLGIGMATLLDACEAFVAEARNVSMGDVTTFDASYRPLGRDAAYWSAEVRVEFWSEREYDVPAPVAASAQTLSTWHDVIRSRVDAYATAQGLEVAWDNAPFTETDGEMFIACRIVDGPITSVEVGPTLRRRCSGKAIVEFRAPIGTGTRDVLRAVDALALEFRAASDSGVRFGVPSARTVGRSGRHWLVIVDVPYRVDEIA